MSKQLEKIIKKAHKTGFANVNGRMSLGWRCGFVRSKVNGKRDTIKKKTFSSWIIGERTS